MTDLDPLDFLPVDLQAEVRRWSASKRTKLANLLTRAIPDMVRMEWLSQHRTVLYTGPHVRQFVDACAAVERDRVA